MSETNNAPVETDIKSLLFAVKKELTITGIEHDIWLLDLLDRAGSRLNTTERVAGKNCNIEIEDNRFKMPGDAKMLYAFRGVGNCYGGIFVDTNFISTCGRTVTGWTGGLQNVITQRGRYFYFTNPIADGSEYELAYSAVNRDCDGLMIVNEECEEALINYACWRFSNAFRRTQSYMLDQVNTWKNDYQDQAKKCRGNAAVRTKNQQRDQISSKFNAILDLSQVAWGSLGSMLPVFYYTNNPQNPYGV